MRWKSFEHLWEVSDSGLVRNKKSGKLLVIRHRSDGYLDVKLNYKRFLIHRLVALLFLDNPYNKPQVNHIDGKKDNPNYVNLEWVDQFENMQHAIALGLRADVSREKNPRCAITEQQANTIKSLLNLASSSISNIAKIMGVTYHTVSNIKYKKAWVD